MKELIEEIMNHCDGIIERSERMTSGNYMHNCAANKFSAKIIKSCVNNLVSGIHWQTGEPKEEGEYIVTLYNGEITFNEYCCITNSDGQEEFFWSNWDEDSIIAWCKLSDIQPYKKETK